MRQAASCLSLSVVVASLAERIIVTIASVTITPFTELTSTVPTKRILCHVLMGARDQSGGCNNCHHTDQNEEHRFGGNYQCNYN